MSNATWVSAIRNVSLPTPLVTFFGKPIQVAFYRHSDLPIQAKYVRCDLEFDREPGTFDSDDVALLVSRNRFTLYCYDQDRTAGRRRRWIIGVAIAVIALAVPAWAFCFRAGQQSILRTTQRNARLLCALEWTDVFPTNPDLKLILPYPDVLRTRAHFFAGAGLLRCHLLSPQLLNQLKDSGPSTDLSHGRLEAASVQEKS